MIAPDLIIDFIAAPRHPRIPVLLVCRGERSRICRRPESAPSGVGHLSGRDKQITRHDARHLLMKGIVGYAS